MTMHDELLETAVPAGFDADDESSNAASRPDPAPMKRRSLAALIDLVPLSIVAYTLRDEGGQAGMLTLSNGRLLLATLISMTYYLASEAITGTTPGKGLLGLKVVGDDGARPGFKAVVLRTFFRLVDGFPVLYLVGFVAAVAGPHRQRVGDRVANTHVVWRTREDSWGLPQTAALLAVAVATLGLAAVAHNARDDSLLGRIEPFSYDVDRALAFADETVVAVFPELSADALMDRWPTDLVSRELTESSLVGLESYSGRLTGEATQLDHREWHNTPITGLPGTYDIAEIRHKVEFENGPGEIWLAVTEVNGEMRLISWRILLDADIVAD